MAKGKRKYRRGELDEDPHGAPSTSPGIWYGVRIGALGGVLFMTLLGILMTKRSVGTIVESPQVAIGVSNNKDRILDREDARERTPSAHSVHHEDILGNYMEDSDQGSGNMGPKHHVSQNIHHGTSEPMRHPKDEANNGKFEPEGGGERKGSHSREKEANVEIAKETSLPVTIVSEPSTQENETEPADFEKSAREREHVDVAAIVNASFNGEWQGVKMGMIDGLNVQHMSYMLSRIITAHSILSVGDLPCSKHADWMKILLPKLKEENLGFHYNCIVTSETAANEMREMYKGDDAVTVTNLKPWMETFPNVDLVFSTGYFQHLEPSKTWRSMKNMKAGGVKYVFFENHVGVGNTQIMFGHRGVMNVRRAPFHFAQPMRVVNGISADGAEVQAQLVLYAIDQLRQGI